MVLILECSRPFQWRPGWFRSRLMTRVWWGWFAVGILHIPLHEFAQSEWDWIPRASRAASP
jgi:hypothetical protein